jgi:hypothetical protein
MIQIGPTAWVIVYVVLHISYRDPIAAKPSHLYEIKSEEKCKTHWQLWTYEEEVTNGSKTALMDAVGFLCVSLGSSTVQLHVSVGCWPPFTRRKFPGTHFC